MDIPALFLYIHVKYPDLPTIGTCLFFPFFSHNRGTYMLSPCKTTKECAYKHNKIFDKTSKSIWISFSLPLSETYIIKI